MSALYAKLQADDGLLVTRQANDRICVRIETWDAAVLLEVAAMGDGTARWTVGQGPKSGTPPNIAAGDTISLGKDPRR